MIQADSRYVARRYTTKRTAGSYSGVSGFLANNPKCRDKDSVRKTLAGIEAYTLHKDARRKFQRIKIQCGSIDHIWSADLIFYPKYAKENKGHRYILLAGDCLS
jgi:hypothetical protein